MSDSIHLGNERYSRAASILEGASVQSNSVVQKKTVNSELFAKVELAETHARRIMETGSSQYITGIKSNVLELIRIWLQQPGEPIFTLYGKMGCGKSFFSAYLNAQMRMESEQYQTIAFSSQQTYRDTTQVRTMLLSLANQLFQNVAACSDYFANILLEPESISTLTEQVLVSSLETAGLTKTLLVIIDGLDEYPRSDCEEFLETLSRLRDRLNPHLKIYFSSRPEEYIRSEMFHDPITGAYSIENNTDQSEQDCLCFIRAKCNAANVQMEEKLQQALVSKCGFSLKYLDCFFNDISCGKICVTEDFINNLPKGLSNYYKDQLIRYFGDKNLEFYQDRIVPLLELLCVAWRPITVDEICDILEWTPRDVQNVISRSGTLLWKNNQQVMLYQSESIKEFLLDERYCPDKYRIECANGDQRILKRLQAYINENIDIDENMYLFDHAADHLLDKQKPSNADWQMVIRLIQAYSHKTDMIGKMPGYILKKPINMVLQFINLLYMDPNLEPILREHFCVRLIAGATEQNCAQADKLLEVFDMLDGMDDYHFVICYGRSRLYRMMGKMDQAEAIFANNPVQKKDELVWMYRYNLYLDETCRIYRRKAGADWRVVTQMHIAAVQGFLDICRKIGMSHLPSQQTAMYGLSVSYDQLGRLCETLENQKDPQLRTDCAAQICALLQLTPGNAEQPGYFLTLAASSHEKSLNQTKRCQQFDSRSNSKIYAMHFSFYALGRLYSTKEFPGYNLQRAVTYFDDCLDSIMPIVEKPSCSERYLDVPIKIYDRLVQVFREAGEYAKARAALQQKARQYDTKVLRKPNMITEFNRCLCYEEEAKIVLEDQGILAAEPYYLEAIRNYRRCAEKYPEERAQRACYIVYANMNSEFDKVKNWDKLIEYLELTIAEAKRVDALYPRDSLRWSIAANLAYLALRLKMRDPKTSAERSIGLCLESLELRKELAKEFPRELKYAQSPFLVYRYIFDYYREQNDFVTLFYYLRECVQYAVATYENIPQQLSNMFAPIKLVVDLRKELREQGLLGKWLQEIEPMLQKVDPATQENFYQRTHFLALDLKAEELAAAGRDAATDMAYLRCYMAGQNYAFAFNDALILQYAVQVYNKYLLMRMEDGAIENSIAPMQQIMADLSQYIQTHEEHTKPLQQQSASLYMRFADAVRKHASVDYLSSVIDLYIMASVQYAGLMKHTGKQEFLRNKIHALSKLAAVTDKLETDLESQPISEKRIRLQLLVKVYGFCAEQRIDGAERKLTRYTKMLEELPEEA